MKKSENILEKFSPEELEHRFEMGWKLKKVDMKHPGIQ